MCVGVIGSVVSGLRIVVYFGVFHVYGYLMRAHCGVCEGWQEFICVLCVFLFFNFFLFFLFFGGIGWD